MIVINYNAFNVSEIEYIITLFVQELILYKDSMYAVIFKLSPRSMYFFYEIKYYYYLYNYLLCPLPCSAFLVKYFLSVYSRAI